MSRGICRDRSDIFHLRKNGMSFARTITNKSGLSRFTLEFRGHRHHAVLSSSWRVLYVLFGSHLLEDLRYLATFFYASPSALAFCWPLILDIVVARTFRMAFNRKSVFSRGTTAAGSRKNERRDQRALFPRITPIKTFLLGEDSSSILPKSDRWQKRLLLRLSAYWRYKREYRYFPFSHV